MKTAAFAQIQEVARGLEIFRLVFYTTVRLGVSIFFGLPTKCLFASLYGDTVLFSASILYLTMT